MLISCCIVIKISRFSANYNKSNSVSFFFSCSINVCRFFYLQNKLNFEEHYYYSIRNVSIRQMKCVLFSREKRSEAYTKWTQYYQSMSMTETVAQSCCCCLVWVKVHSTKQFVLIFGHCVPFLAFLLFLKKWNVIFIVCSRTKFNLQFAN